MRAITMGLRLFAVLRTAAYIGGVLAMSSSSSIGCAAGAAPAVLEDATCRIEFDAEGGLQRLVNRRLGDECLKGGHPGLMPFRLYADPTREFVIDRQSSVQQASPSPLSRRPPRAARFAFRHA